MQKKRPVPHWRKRPSAIQKGKRERERENDRPFVFQGCSSLLTLKAYKAEERLKRPRWRLRKNERERRKVFFPHFKSAGFEASLSPSRSLSSSSGFFSRPYFTAGEPLTWKRSRSVRMMFAFCRLTFLRGFFSRAWERSEILDAKSRICINSLSLSACWIRACIYSYTCPSLKTNTFLPGLGKLLVAPLSVWIILIPKFRDVVLKEGKTWKNVPGKNSFWLFLKCPSVLGLAITWKCQL